MSGTVQNKPTQERSGGSGRFGRPERSGRPNRGPRKEEEQIWIPRTDLGKNVAAGLITNMDEIYSNGLRIQEAGIIKKLLPDLKSEVIDVGMVQTMTPNGQRTKFKALVAAGKDRKSTRLNSSHTDISRMPASA